MTYDLYIEYSNFQSLATFHDVKISSGWTRKFNLTVILISILYL